MKEQETPLEAFEVRAFCDCGGEMKPGREVLAMNPPLYPHTCDKCGTRENFKTHYPAIRHRKPSPLRNLSKSLIEERGMSCGVAISRKDQREGYMRMVSVGEFLADPTNQSGSWYIDGGWGGPPGPIRVDWDPFASAWFSRGFPPHD